jgi:iron complex transport system substrate-binding protein
MRRPLIALLVLPLAAAAAFGSPAGVAASAAGTASPGFAIERRQGYAVATVRAPWPGAARGYTYVLYPRGAPKPRRPVADGYFEVPLRRIVAFSTTYVAQLSALGELGRLVGVDDAASVSDPGARSLIASGAIVETARNGVPNVERLLALAPDAIFAYGMGNEWDIQPKLSEAGLPVILSGDWNESDPLARAAWIEFIAAFVGREALAASLRAATEAEYLRVRALAAGEPGKPAVLVNGPFQGTWPVSGGASYMAKLIADAGGSYLWADDARSGALSLSVEAVYERALRAEVWLNPAGVVASKADLSALDPRLAGLPAVRAGRVWNASLRRGPGGGNDYFESAVLHPDRVLADLAKIFHPRLLADRPFSYYENVAR